MKKRSVLVLFCMVPLLVLACAGDPGPTGPMGPEGEIGLTGPTGALAVTNVLFERGLYPTAANAGVYDSTLFEVTPSSNSGTNGLLFVADPAPAGERRRALLRFSLTDRPVPAGAMVLSGLLSLHTPGTDNTAGTMAVRASRVLEAWTEGDGTSGSGADWDTSNGVDAWSSPGGGAESQAAAAYAAGEGEGWWTFDVTGLVRSWVLSEEGNLGILLSADVEGRTNGARSFDSSECAVADRRPRLSIRYTME